ncbi:hypothetical protein DY000_02044410 [Brassica cretica]|uniref:Uncharacterized protein n=1 Tax=Brassica cretica TaxID=69181 RepID=A0ABQ7F823_BRACR|nr:hypothetical protein DY000_02044410 [Brassica cretica]
MTCRIMLKMPSGGPNFGRYINGRDQRYGPRTTEAHSKHASSRRSQRSPEDRGTRDEDCGAVMKVTKSTYYKGRRMDTKKGRGKP